MSPDRRGAAVLGSPISHSLSPVLHQAAYDALGLDGWAYRAIECIEADLGATLRSLDDEGLAGVSLTMPLKRAVLDMLASTDNATRTAGVANTVLFGATTGEWVGANTDVRGMTAVLRAVESLASRDGTAWILGAGATAASALTALAQFGFRRVAVAARRPDATAELAILAERIGVRLTVHPWSEIAAATSAPLVIATTPVGATDQLAATLPAVSGLLFDLVYARWPTVLATAWKAAGGQVVGGLELLVEQAAEQVRLMTGKTPPVDQMRRAGYAALNGRP
ncbi:MAG TPA: shikimate dehydrogenase [Mycobacteriales bacterium]|nr:shikimate dehydrogenase [Mycobacteriales bacterium]